MIARVVRDPAALFGRHLDLTPLRHRRRGLVPCCFHEDRTGSLSVDLDRGLFHCFGCGAQGGLRDFAERVGETSAQPRRPPPRESLLQEARRRAAQQARRNEERAAEWSDWMQANEFIRQARRGVDEARHAAGLLGPAPRSWALLERAAHMETIAATVEALLDDILASGRLA